MKPFNLEQAKAGKPVQTRDGRAARIICFDFEPKPNIFCILAVIRDNFTDKLVEYDAKGKELFTECETKLDLFMASEKKSGWINIYPYKYTGDIIFDTKEQALKFAETHIVDTIYIEWME